MLCWDNWPLLDRGSGFLPVLGVAMLKLSGNPAHADPDHTGLGAMGLGGVTWFNKCALNLSVWRSCFNIELNFIWQSLHHLHHMYLQFI
jgi:hypothetical protein